jgi:hypothetical protein
MKAAATTGEICRANAGLAMTPAPPCFHLYMLDIESGGALKIAGTSVSTTAAELNYNDVATLGTLAASKSWTSDASLDTIMPTGGLLTVQSGGQITLSSGSTLAVAGTFTNGGVAVPVIRVAEDAIVSGQTAKTVTVTGATAASKCVATANEIPTNDAYIKSAAPGTDQVVVTVNTDPGASNLDITVICLD